MTDLPVDDLAHSLAAASKQRGYWAESRQPLASLVFVTPLLILYEGGVLLLGPAAMRNGADVWLRQLLVGIGFGQYLLLPALTVGMLLGWHHLTHQPWRVSSLVLAGMAAECAVLAMALICIAQMVGQLLSFALPTAALGSLGEFFERFVDYCGAGLYEEVLFRLLLLPATAALIRMLGAKPVASEVAAVIITSLAFSAAHYIGAHGDAFELRSFIFRFCAGAFFAALFSVRGFGVAAGTHALYDIFVGLF